MNIVFCHGVIGPDEEWHAYDTAFGWKNWLQFVVELRHDVIMQTPKFPHAHALLMKYDEWERIMDYQEITPDTILIGHSAGGGFVLKYLSKHPKLKVRQVVLVAPYIDVEDTQPFGFYKDLKLDNIMAQTKLGVDIISSDDDFPYIKSSVDKISQDIPEARIHKFSGHGHFTGPEIPEILPIIKF